MTATASVFVNRLPKTTTTTTTAGVSKSNPQGILEQLAQSVWVCKEKNVPQLDYNNCSIIRSEHTVK